MSESGICYANGLLKRDWDRPSEEATVLVKSRSRSCSTLIPAHVQIVDDKK